MISKKYIKQLEFKTIEDLFNYIVESEINGNYSQCKELLNKLSSSQFKDYLNYLKDFNDNVQVEKALKYRLEV